MQDDKKVKTVLLPLQPKSVFLIDAAGAALTCITIGYLLPQLQWLVGVLPGYVYTILAGIAFTYGVYSLFHGVVAVKSWRFRLWLISTANIIYSVIILIIVALNIGNLTFLGVMYFLVESAVVIWLARQEYWYSAIKVNPADTREVVPHSVGRETGV